MEKTKLETNRTEKIRALYDRVMDLTGPTDRELANIEEEIKALPITDENKKALLNAIDDVSYALYVLETETAKVGMLLCRTL